MDLLRRLAGIALGLGVALGAGCYQPTLRDCTVTCSGADDCAGDQVCGLDGYCSLPETAGSCGDGGATDAPLGPDAVSADADPDSPDAEPLVDAGPAADAAPPDAAGPLVVLKVRVVGTGRLVSEQFGIACNGNCNYDLPMGSTVTLTPVVTDDGWHFLDWTSEPCLGQSPDCTLTLTATQQTARGRFVQ
jgi:hypothetical protein